MRRIIASSMTVLAAGLLLSGSPPAATTRSGAGVVLAHYPLGETAADARGLQDPIQLVNAPFDDGGILCNGIYPASPGGCLVETPPITGLDFESLAISFEFRIAGRPIIGPMPIIMGGRLYRWLGAEMDADGRVWMRINNDYRVPADIVTDSGWHEVLMVYGPEGKADIYLDGVMGVQITVLELNHGNERQFSTTNFGSGLTFNGWIRNLVIHGAAFDPLPIPPTSWGAVKALLR